MNYIIGIDGGGTKTHCVLATRDKAPLFECSGGPSNFLMLGTETVSATILDLIKQCTESQKIGFQMIDAVLLGTTGAGRRSDAEILERDFSSFLSKQNLRIRNFSVESDARIALEGAFSGREGCILIAGTGSILFGKDNKDRIYRVGGFGRFLGDEGSGYMLGRRGLIAAAKNFDGRGPETLLLNLLSQEFKITSPEDLITRIYRENFDIASFAPMVVKAAEQGDQQAVKILEEEIDELVLHIKAIKKKIIVATLQVSFIGGLIANDTYYSCRFRQKISETMHDVNVIDAENSPAYGAVLMAAKKLSGN
ncbi:MAG: N-acetylglucosamine kinase [Ignavibacteriales bacterium]